MKYLLPRFRDLLFIVIFVAVLSRGSRLFGDGDIGRHITLGTVILESGRFPPADLFSHTMYAKPSAPLAWLGQVTFAIAHRLLGLDGIVILTAFVLALAYTLLYQTLVNQGTDSLLALLLTALATFVSTTHFLARPHIFTMLCMALWTPLVLSARREGKNKHILLMALVMWAWTNLHAAFVAGLTVWAIVFIGSLWEWSQKQLPAQSIKILGLGGLASFLVTLVNPGGINMLTTSLSWLQNKFLVDHTEEYLSPNFHDANYLPFLGMVALLIFALSRGAKKLSTAEGLLAAAWAAWGLYSMRNIPLFCIVVTPMIASTLQTGFENMRFLKNLSARLQSVETQLRGFAWPATAVILSIVLAMNGAFRGRNSWDPQLFPVQAMDWVETHPQSGYMFNYFIWGGYITYRAWPEYLVFIDGQTDIYGEALSREYVRVIDAEAGWESVLTKYQVDWAIIPVGGPLPKALEESGWTLLYEDETAIILRR